MSPSIGMMVAEILENNPDFTREETENFIRANWAFGVEEAVEVLRVNYKYYKKLGMAEKERRLKRIK